jgi:hypothetical protein
MAVGLKMAQRGGTRRPRPERRGILAVSGLLLYLAQNRSVGTSYAV